MQRIRSNTLLLASIACLLGGGVPAQAEPAAPGFLPANAKPHGQSLVELATAYMAWGLSAPPDVNPLLNPRCEQSTIDPHIWFVPVSLGGELEVTCDVPQGSFLVILAGGVECSEAEGSGSTEGELLDCVEAGFATITNVEVTLDGNAATLDDYVVTTLFDVLPPDNVFSADPTPTMTKGYFLVTTPLSRGTHMLRTFDEFSDGFQAGATFTIIVR